MSFSIGSYQIGEGFPPFVIAEMSGNHNQSLECALAIVDAAAASGVQALKIQTYTADTMTLDCNQPGFVIQEESSLWHGNSLYSLYEKAHTPWEWHEAIFDRCRERGIIGFSTPFDESAVDFLESLNVPIYKVASFENSDLKLLKRLAQTRKPILVSTGLASFEELEESVHTLKEAGCKDLVLLKCTSTYPASAENSNLSTIPHLRRAFAVEVGLSDHTQGIGVSIASVVYGASVIEKHFVLDRSAGGVDAVFSLEPAEMKMLVFEVNQAWKARGGVSYGPTEAERKSLQFRRSLYVVRDMKAGEAFSNENVRAIRPGFGLPVKHYEEILGKRAKKDISKGTPATWDLVE